jgi:hypothetical protein
MSYRNNRSRYRTVRYRFATSVSAGVLVAVAVAIAGDENVKHHTGQAVPFVGVAAAGGLVAGFMFVAWSAFALYLAAGRRARERERADAAAERERQARGRGRGRRYAGSPR